MEKASIPMNDSTVVHAARSAGPCMASKSASSAHVIASMPFGVL